LETVVTSHFLIDIFAFCIKINTSNHQITEFPTKWEAGEPNFGANHPETM
jgi:hypothetical protein